MHVFEKPEGSPVIQTKPPTVKRLYTVVGTTDSLSARLAISNTSPATQVLSGCLLFRQGIELQPLGKGTDAWDGIVSYGLQINAIQFNTGGGTTKITQSLGTRQIYRAAGEDAESVPDFGGAIGYNGQGFDGCDITIPQFNWTETHTFQINALTYTYTDTLMALTGRINAYPFRGKAAGEVLFMGASGGNQKNETEADVQFSFSASPNVTGLTVGTMTGIAKRGWDYIWVLYKEDSTTKFRYKKPIGAYIEPIYYEADFSLLGIG